MSEGVFDFYLPSDPSKKPTELPDAFVALLADNTALSQGCECRCLRTATSKVHFGPRCLSTGPASLLPAKPHASSAVRANLDRVSCMPPKYHTPPWPVVQQVKLLRGLAEGRHAGQGGRANKMRTRRDSRTAHARAWNDLSAKVLILTRKP
jgi:hypothetical protein